MGRAFFFALLACTFFPSKTWAESSQDSTTTQIQAVCSSDNASTLVPILRQLSKAPAARLAVADALFLCSTGTSSTRAVLIVGYLESHRRVDLLRRVIAQSPSPRTKLRAAVALANLEGDYGALALAISRAVSANLPPPMIRHALGYLNPPLHRPRTGADVHAQAAVRSWLDHFGILNGRLASWAQVPNPAASTQ